MVYHSADDLLPKDVTFFIGPVGAPPRIKKFYDEAIALSNSGDEALLEEFLTTTISTLRDFAEGSPQKPSILKSLLEVSIDSKIGELSTFVAKGYLRGTWTPIVTIYLDRLTAPNGSPLGHLVKKSHGEYIAAILGKTFKAEWIYTSWVYPSTPIDISLSHNMSNGKEV
jgi:hypothetical protein